MRTVALRTSQLGRSIDDATLYRSIHCVCVCVCVCYCVWKPGQKRSDERLRSRAVRRRLSAATPVTSDRISYLPDTLSHQHCDDRCIGSIIVHRACLSPLPIVQQLSFNTHLCPCSIQQSFIIAKKSSQNRNTHTSVLCPIYTQNNRCCCYTKQFYFPFIALAFDQNRAIIAFSYFLSVQRVFCFSFIHLLTFILSSCRLTWLFVNIDQ